MRKLVVLFGLLLVLTTSLVPAFAQSGNTIVDIAIADGRFDTLVAAVVAADLAETLSGPGPFTVFAPTDAAFAALGEDTISALLADPATLAQVLTYHVVPGRLLAADVVAANNLSSVQGSPIGVDVTDDGVFLNIDSQIIITDIQASNGVIHVIDTVILPPTPLGADDLFVVTGNGSVLSEPGGSATGATVRTCQTFFVDRYDRGFAHLAAVGGWVDSRLLYDVAEDYGQPGGQERLPGC